MNTREELIASIHKVAEAGPVRPGHHKRGRRMMMAVRLDLIVDDSAISMGSVSSDEPMGSISSDEHDGEPRRIFLFGWPSGQLGASGMPVCGVFESVLGYDVANGAVREVTSANVKLLSDLSEPYELTIYRRTVDGATPRLLRFTVADE